MTSLSAETSSFVAAKAQFESEQRQLAAVFLSCGMDLQNAFLTAGEERDAVQRRLRRLIERERLRGVGRHWSYDLNRHIALKQAYDRLLVSTRGQEVDVTGNLHAQKHNPSSHHVPKSNTYRSSRIRTTRQVDRRNRGTN